MSLILSERALLPSLPGDTSSIGGGQPRSYELGIPASDQASTASSRGYKRSLDLRHGLNLLIRDYWLHEVLIEERLPVSSGLTLEFGFNLIGNDLDGEDDSSLSSSFVQLSENQTCPEFEEWQIKGRIVKIDLHLTTPDTFQGFSAEQLELIPSELRTMIDQPVPDWHRSLGAISPNIQLVLQQIINCPYMGSIQQVYLEGKALELIALQAAQLVQLDPHKPRPSLKRSDVDRIYQARELVTQQLDNPPSLLNLAHAVGLNDCTLKRGFRQVFGTTVFGYIRQQRLAKARQLLQNTEMSVAEVTCLVGYAHPGHFAAAFKREFGVSPKIFKNSVR